MNRLNLLLIALLAGAFLLYSAPEFVISVLIGVAVIVAGLRWFVRGLGMRHRSRGVWR